ncbi:uncharacterized protein [Diadema setosum]|uniref:uncharacterized protein n=1 Tax=Diadema setosum TaxID=31175 RepID=UPI003B3B8658
MVEELTAVSSIGDVGEIKMSPFKKRKQSIQYSDISDSEEEEEKEEDFISLEVHEDHLKVDWLKQRPSHSGKVRKKISMQRSHIRADVTEISSEDSAASSMHATSKLTNLHLRLGIDNRTVALSCPSAAGAVPGVAKKTSIASSNSVCRSENEGGEWPVSDEPSSRKLDAISHQTDSPELVELYTTDSSAVRQEENLSSASSDVICLDSPESCSRVRKRASPITITSSSDADDCSHDDNSDVEVRSRQDIDSADSDSDSSLLPELPMSPKSSLSPKISLSPKVSLPRTPSPPPSRANKQCEDEHDHSAKTLFDTQSHEDCEKEEKVKSSNCLWACWSSLESAPEHMKCANSSVKSVGQNRDTVKCGDRISSFSTMKLNTIDTCIEEIPAAMDFICSFATSKCKPDARFYADLIRNTLPSCRTSVESALVYQTMKFVQHLHHPGVSDMLITWEDLKHLGDVLIRPPCNSFEWHKDLAALRLVASVLEDDVERKLRWNTARRPTCHVHAILNPDTCKDKCKVVARWIHSLVVELRPPPTSSNSTSARRGKPSLQCRCPEGLCHMNHVLPVFEKLLQISIALTERRNHKDHVEMIAREINGLHLQGLPQMQLIFETLKHDFLSLRLAELTFNWHFESEYGDISSLDKILSLSKIVGKYFQYVPKRCRNDESGDASDSEETDYNDNSLGFKERKREDYLRWYRQQVVVMVYLLLIMFKCYLKCYLGEATQQRSSSRPAPGLKKHGELKLLQVEEDKLCLLQIGDSVDQLRTRLLHDCQGQLDPRAKLWLNEMSLLYEWVA